ncbi:MAG: hypothetical protein HS123_24030 [Solibacteraceae bacterium]|nr:hypothetical protein [Solibacteraceae bacterium]
MVCRKFLAALALDAVPRSAALALTQKPLRLVLPRFCFVVLLFKRASGDAFAGFDGGGIASR